MTKAEHPPLPGESRALSILLGVQEQDYSKAHHPLRETAEKAPETDTGEGVAGEVGSGQFWDPPGATSQGYGEHNFPGISR